MTKRLLIVDDEEMIIRSLCRALDDLHIDIFQAFNADEALNILSENRIDILLTDNMMPGMNGLELLAIVKKQYPDTIRMMMTGYADLKTAVSAINSGEIYKFIVKPWDNIEIISIIVEAVERIDSGLSVGDSE